MICGGALTVGLGLPGRLRQEKAEKKIVPAGTKERKAKYCTT